MLLGEGTEGDLVEAKEEMMDSDAVCDIGECVMDDGLSMFNERAADLLIALPVLPLPRE